VKCFVEINLRVSAWIEDTTSEKLKEDQPMKQQVILRLSLALALTISAVICGNATAAQTPQLPLAPALIPQFIQPLPLLSVSGGSMATVAGNQPLTVTMCEFDSQVLPPPMPTTRVWGYIPGVTCPTATQDTYIGPVIVNTRGTSTDITWVNNLGTTDSTGVLAYKYSTDQTLHWADPLNMEANDCQMVGGIPAFGSACAQNYVGPIPTVPHLHGGEVPPELDGGPTAWFTSDGVYRGSGYYSFAGALPNEAIYKYPNTQEASPIWFHDHTLGVTRLSVYAGLAGAYLITDPALNLPAGLHPAGLMNGANNSVEYTVPLVIQDRMFDTNGQFFYQTDSAGGVLWATNPEHPYWSPELVGDTLLVNGKTWPYLDVEPKRYRFWFINGSNARTYEMNVVDPKKTAPSPKIWVIATDGGYLDKPVSINKLVMMPGERYEAIIDFGGMTNGTNFVLKNTAKTPFPAGATPQGATLGTIMQFRVGGCTSGFCGATDASYNPALGTPIRIGGQIIQRLVDPAKGTLAFGVTAQNTRQLTLNEVMGMPQLVTDPVTGVATAYPGGPLEILVNNTKWSGMSPRNFNDFTKISVNGIDTYYSELPKEGETEVWELINLTADAHPIHLHLVQFQLMNRQAFDVGKYSATYAAAFPGGGSDPMNNGAPYPSGVFMPGFGPPLNYKTGSVNALGGNPDINATKMTKKGSQPVYLQGQIVSPDPNEAGWKDTVIVYPGQVTRLVVRWAPTDAPATAAPANLSFPFDPSGESKFSYVWHCHIIDHEDNEMMRPDMVLLNQSAPSPSNRILVKGVNY